MTTSAVVCACARCTCAFLWWPKSQCVMHACDCVCVSMQVHRLSERWAPTAGRPPCPLAISVPCLPWRPLRNDPGDSDRSLFVVSISHNWASVPEGQVYRIRTGLHNAESTDTPLMPRKGCVCVSEIDFTLQKSNRAEVDWQLSAGRTSCGDFEQGISMC